MSSVAQADSTYAYIAQKVRYLTASSSESALPSALIAQYVNNFYNQNFPNAIKTDQMRCVYTFYTAPYVDKYFVDTNYYQGFRFPMYVDGVPGTFFKDRQQFFYMWPQWPTLSQPISGNGMKQQYSFTVGSVPFFRGTVTLGGTDTNGNPIQVCDDGLGNLQYTLPNPMVSIPAQNTNPAIPGMYNQNTGNPGLINPTNIGTVNYVTGSFVIDFAMAPGNVVPVAGQNMQLFVSQYQTARPYSLLFWNNYFLVRPVPKFVHQITIEAYQTPVQFLTSTNNPIVNQWAKYIAYGAAIDILNDRSDFQGAAAHEKAFKEQEGLVLEKQANEELFQRNATIFSGTQQGLGNYYGAWGSWF